MLGDRTGDQGLACGCEGDSVDYVFGLAGNKPLARKIDEVSDTVRTEQAVDNKAVVRGYTETRHAAGSWHCECRVVARIKATEQGLDIRYVVTSLHIGSAEWIYDSLYCARLVLHTAGMGRRGTHYTSGRRYRTTA